MVKNYINTNFEQESGRSMVEMLGVLAIIGVLSVGGISGYTTAMNKHKANEILNAAAVRAMAVSTQLQNGAETPTLDEFTENKVGDATFTGVSTSGDKFTITLTGLDDKIKKQIENIAGTDGIVRAITSGGLTYNDDLSTDARPSDYNSDETGKTCQDNDLTWCAGSKTCLAGTSLDCKNTCVGTDPCKSGCDETGARVALPADEDKACTTSANEAGTCTNGTCVATPSCLTSGSCTSNTKNGDEDITLCSGYFCDVGVDSDDDWSTCHATSGSIEAVGTYETQGGYTYSTSKTMTWDAADNWCKAVLGNDHGLADKGEIDEIDGTNCTGEYGGDCAVYQKLGHYGTYWLDDGGSNSCYASFVNVYSYGESVSSGNRDASVDSVFALCE